MTDAQQPAEDAQQESVATAPDAAKVEGKKSLEDLLSGLDDDARSAILGEVSKARSEAANYRTKLREAEPRLSEYNRLVEASKSELEKAQEAASQNASRAAQAMERVARAEVKSALAGLVDNPDAIIEDLNLSRFVGEDGEVNADALDALRQKYAAFGSRRAPRPDHSQASAANGRTSATPASEFASFIQGQLNRQ